MKSRGIHKVKTK